LSAWIIWTWASAATLNGIGEVQSYGGFYSMYKPLIYKEYAMRALFFFSLALILFGLISLVVSFMKAKTQQQ